MQNVHLLSWMNFWEHKYPSVSLWVGFACFFLFSEIVPHYCSYLSESLMVRNLFFPIVPVCLLEQPYFKLSPHAATTRASVLWSRCSATRETSATEKPPKREAPALQLEKAWSHKPYWTPAQPKTKTKQQQHNSAVQIWAACVGLK